MDRGSAWQGRIWEFRLHRPEVPFRLIGVNGLRLALGDVGAFGCLRSLRAHQALEGASRVQSGSVEIAVGQAARALHNPRRHLLPPAGVAPLGSSVRSPLRLRLLGYASSNSVPCRSMACMITARGRASAIFALRIVDRLAIAQAHSLSFSGPL